MIDKILRREEGLTFDVFNEQEASVNNEEVAPELDEEGNPIL